ncbi:MAG TPA: methyltransferase [Polyangiaceae bacterium]|nr:methyltransferase [Polyangiaceae bacterium]
MTNQAPPGPPPPAQLLQILTSKWVSQAIGVVAELNIADHVASGPKTAAELATLTNSHERSLYRMLRTTASVGVFSEDAEGRFGLTPMAELLRSDVPGSMRAAAVCLNMDAMWRPYGHIAYSVKTGKSAFEHVYKSNAFQYFREHPEEAKVFNAGLVNFASLSAGPLAVAYDFSRFTKLVDVGGGQGFLLAAILKANPSLKGVVFDQPAVIEQAKPLLKKEGVDDRAEAIGGDFFESVPGGGDVYTIKSCLHDWDDDNVVRILKVIRKSMPSTATLLLIESLVPKGNDPHFSKLSDVEMLVLAGGIERRDDEWRDLLAKGGFTPTRTIATRGPVSIIEATPA